MEKEEKRRENSGVRPEPAGKLLFSRGPGRLLRAKDSFRSTNSLETTTHSDPACPSSSSPLRRTMKISTMAIRYPGRGRAESRGAQRRLDGQDSTIKREVCCLVSTTPENRFGPPHESPSVLVATGGRGRGGRGAGGWERRG